MAMLVQYLAGKLGLATGRSLPELCRARYPRPVTWGLWVQAELVAMATDLAKFVGAAVALNLLFGVPLLPAGLITAGITVALLALRPGAGCASRPSMTAVRGGAPLISVQIVETFS